MDTATLKRILLEELAGYAGEGLNAHSLLTINEAAQTYAVIDFAQIRDQRIVAAVLVARLVNDQIYIDLDLNDKTLAEALKARGIPPAQIVLTYRQDSLAV